MIIYVMGMVMNYNALDGVHCLLFSFIMFIYHMKKLVLVSQYCDG
jgi:hypothetical protein